MKREYRWIAQDWDGRVCGYEEIKPNIFNITQQWSNNNDYKLIHNGTQNPNWQDSIIELEKESYEIVNGILERRPKKVKLTDTQLLDAIVEHKLCVDITYTDAAVSDGTGRLAFNKKGNIRKAIKKWLKENT
jgi:hypothetical protein